MSLRIAQDTFVLTSCFVFNITKNIRYIIFDMTKLSSLTFLILLKRGFWSFLTKHRKVKNRCVIITHIYPAGIFLLKVHIKKKYVAKSIQIYNNRFHTLF